MEDGTAADPHSGTGAAASAAERCGAPVPGSRSKAAALLGAFKTRGDCNSSPPPTPPTPTQTPDPCSSPFLPINFGDTLMVATPPPDEVAVLKQLLHDANVEMVTLRTMLLSATTSQASAVSGVQSLSKENLELRDELVSCKAAVAQFEFQREQHRLELNTVRKELKSMRDREPPERQHSGSSSQPTNPGRRSPWNLKPAQGALSLATAISNRIRMGGSGRNSPTGRLANTVGPARAAQHQPDHPPVPPGDNGAIYPAHDRVSSPGAGGGTVDKPREFTMSPSPRAAIPARKKSFRAAASPTLRLIAHLSYERSLTKAVFESWGFKLSSRITDGVWVHTMVDIMPEGPADKAGLGRFGPGIEVLVGLNGKATFGTDGDGVAKQMRSRSTLLQITVVTSDDFADLLSSMAETFDGHLVHANNRLMQIKTPLGLCFFPHPEGDQAMSQPSPPRQPPRPPQGPIRERAHPSPKPMSQHPTLHPPQRPLLSTPQPPWQPAPELEAEFCGVGKTGAAAATPMAGGESDRYGENRALSRRHSHSAAEATENGDHLSHQIPKPDDGSRLSFL